jgi:D-alanyl-D-alanine carboxypeptidase/D-alanyl-D-alanine-endopeptidase (penicillin-binding protein 4)
MNSSTLRAAGVVAGLALIVVANDATAQKRTKRTATPTRSVSAKKPADPPKATADASGVGGLSSSIASALSSHTRGGEWGAIVVSLTRGDTLFSHNADVMMQPASTMKMYTSAVALDQLGPDFTFRTPVLRDGPVGNDGTLNGNLYLKGVGDPSMSPRFWHDEEPMEALAKQIAATGLKRVRGDLIGDATAFEDKLVPDGWKTSYLGAAYAARVSALSLNENLVWVAVRPAGGNALVTLEPATTVIPVESTVRLVSGSRGNIRAVRRSDGAIVVSGTIGANSGPLKYSLVVDNPALFTTGALRAALKKEGIQVDGQTRLGQTPASAAEVAAVASPPLAQIIGEMDRESINVVAELLYRASAHAATKQMATAESSLSHLRQLMANKVRTSPNFVDVSDGSGLSLLDRVTPRSMVQLLGYAHRADWGPAFHAALPVEGESGTLKRRAAGTPARGNLHAKTGTTNTVAALGGFVTAKNGEVLAFSLIYNGNDRGNAKAAMDQIGANMADFVRE